MSPAKQPGMRPANPRADRPFKPPGMSPANTVNDMAQNWTPSSWRNKPIQQVPDYPDAEALKVTEARLAKFPPLVFAGEARALKSALADVAEGRGFCSRAGIAPRASPSTIRTTSATSSACSCRWPLC
jgi:hypothetical protein